MNIIEAVKSGMPFKRKNGLNWIKRSDIHSTTIFVSDAVIDDWIIDEPEVEVTATKLREAYTRYCESIKITTEVLPWDHAINGIIKELGL